MVSQAGDVSIYRWGDLICIARHENDQHPLFLAQQHDFPTPALSSDGALVAYLVHDISYDEIWLLDVVNGEARRRMTTEPVMESYGLDNLQVMHLKWIPGTHQLAFNTGIAGNGGFTFADLHILNADTHKYRQVVTAPAAHQTGDWAHLADDLYPSPDGKHIALVTGESVSIIGVDGSSPPSPVFQYDGIVTYASYVIYVKPTWTPNSDRMWIAVPPESGETELEVWYVSVAGEVRQIASIPLDVPEGYAAGQVILPLVEHAYISPSGEWVVYADPAQDVITVSTLDGMKTAINLEDNVYLQGWIDETHFAFTRYGGDAGTHDAVDYIGDVNGTYSRVEVPPGSYFPCSP